MEYRSMVRFKTKVSLVVSPIDEFTAEPRSGGNINIFLENHPGKPIRKADGYFVFTDLPEGTYHVSVQSDVYLNEGITVDLEKINPAAPVVFLALKPNSSYPFPEGTTLIRAVLRDSKGNAIRGARVKAVVLSLSCAKAKLAQGGLKKGSREMCLVNVAGKVSVGNKFLITEKEEVRSEYCEIAGVLGEPQCFTVAEALQQDHSRGALLMPVTETRTDHKGEFVVYFRNSKAKQFDVKLEFSYENKTVISELKLAEGKMISLGVIQI